MEFYSAARRCNVGAYSRRPNTCRKEHKWLMHCGLDGSNVWRPWRPNPWTRNQSTHICMYTSHMRILSSNNPRTYTERVTPHQCTDVRECKKCVVWVLRGQRESAMLNACMGCGVFGVCVFAAWRCFRCSGSLGPLASASWSSLN